MESRTDDSGDAIVVYLDARSCQRKATPIHMFGRMGRLGNLAILVYSEGDLNGARKRYDEVLH